MSERKPLMSRTLFDVPPLDRVTSIKTKFSIVIVAAVGIAAVVSQIGVLLGVRSLITAPIAFVTTLAAVRLLARGLTSPLREMEDAAAEIAKGNYERRVDVTTRDELGRLAEEFNAMAAELAEVDRLRRDLVANVSHELRTPLSALQAHLENLVDGVEPADPDVLRTMLAQSERLSRMVAQLLDLSRLESGASPLHLEPVELRAVLDQAATETRLHHPDADISVEVRPDGLEMDADGERLHQVVANLLENAARYAPTGSPVVVDAEGDDRRVVIHVTDHGPGIPPAERARIFERFYRTDAARGHDGEGGAGLGLAIARWIVELHGGQIRAADGAGARPFPGCVMTVELPRHAGT